MNPSQISEITNYINSFRIKHLSPNLTYSQDISDFSTKWASNLLDNNKFEHSGNVLYGENLAMRSGSALKNDIVAGIKKSVDEWYNEIQYYDFTNGKFDPKTGHFTALVWADTKKYGIAYKFDEIKKKYVVVMNMSPPGNVQSKFRENVLKASR